MRDVLLLDIELLRRLVLIGEIDTAGNSLLFTVIIILFKLLDSMNLDCAGSSAFFGIFLFFFLLIQNCLSFWLGEKSFLGISPEGFLHLVQLVDVESEDFVGLVGRGIELDLKD